MLRPDRDISRVYLCRKPVDMRKQMDGLAAIVKEVLGLDPLLMHRMEKNLFPWIASKPIGKLIAAVAQVPGCGLTGDGGIL